MAELLTVPLKKTSDLDLVRPFQKLISQRFGSADSSENLSEAISEFQKLRNNVTLRTLDKQESSIEIYAR